MLRRSRSSVGGKVGSRATLLGALILGLLPPAGQASPVWCSPFELDNGVPVTHEQAAAVVDNRVGAAGETAGSVATLAPPVYVQYGMALTGIPALLDPSGATGGFGLSTPDDRGTGINTGLRSNAGNLANALTFEGYFLMPSATPVTSPTYVARRLVTQKRDASGQSRLAVGVHAARVGVVEGLYEYEGFDYPFPDTPVMAGRTGGIGWDGGWSDGDNDFQCFSNDGVSLTSAAFPFTAVGSRLSKTGAGEIARGLSRTVDLSQEGNVLFLSFLMNKTPQAATSAEALEINFTPNAASTTQLARFGMTSDEKFFLLSTATTMGTVVAGETYFVIVKLVSHAGDDQVFMSVYDSTETVPLTEPETWDRTASITGSNSGATIGGLRIATGGNVVDGQVDEIRIGSNYASVTDPNALLGNPGQIRNVLAVMWGAETTPGDPLTLVNNLGLGMTPVEANTWYHFALIHDGTDLTWYLDGVQQGKASAAGLVPPGIAQMAIANHRVAGANDRGFYGIIDEVRLWDRALTVQELLVNGGGPGAGLIWRSRFETDHHLPVTNGQPANTFSCIDNSAGSPNGTPAGIVASFYAAYGETGVPAIPSGPTDLDPGHLAGSFALSLPDVPFVAINTKLPSNAGNLANATTVQGYFNTARTQVITTTLAGNRLVTLMRGNEQGAVRLGIGVGPNADASPTHSVLSLAWADTAEVLAEVKGTTPIVAGTWYHFAMVYDGTNVRWYLNGVQEGELLAPALAPAGSGEIIIGNDRSLSGGRGFYGLLDKIVISDHVIAAEQFMTASLDPCLGKWCNTPFADFDVDNDVDMADFGAFQRCFLATPLLEGNPCLCLDKDNSAVVDLADLAEFLKCVTGPSVIWSPELAPRCNP